MFRSSMHDYKRHGTTTLFTTLNLLAGKVIGTCMKRHRHQEYLQVSLQIDLETTNELDVHVIADNYCTHKHETVQNWLAKHPRFHMHSTRHLRPGSMYWNASFANLPTNAFAAWFSGTFTNSPR
jgi:hypothetical protein